MINPSDIGMQQGIDGEGLASSGVDVGSESNAAEGVQETGMPSACCCVRHKETPRSAELQSDVQKRLNRIIGQLRGVKGMIEDNRYCGDVLIQLAAVDAAVKAVSREVLQNHLETCVVEQIQRGNTEVVDEVMRLFKKLS